MVKMFSTESVGLIDVTSTAVLMARSLFTPSHDPHRHRSGLGRQSVRPEEGLRTDEAVWIHRFCFSDDWRRGSLDEISYYALIYDLQLDSLLLVSNEMCERCFCKSCFTNKKSMKQMNVEDGCQIQTGYSYMNITDQ